jgi:SIR2-like protein
MFVVFAGAGASKAVDPTQYPTTVEFFERLPASIKNTSMFELVVNMLHSHHGRDITIDIEQVLWSLAELTNFLKNVTNVRTVPGWFLKDARLLQPISLKTDFGNLLGSASRVLKVIEEITGNIGLQIYEWYAKQPTRDQLAPNWLTLLPPILRSGDRLDLFTTNYDLVLEVVADELAAERLPVIRTGRKGAIQRTLDESEWLSPLDSGSPLPAGGLLTKLHGSVDFERAPDGTIYVGAPFFKGSHDRHAILYPGFKGTPDREPFTLFHSHFARAVTQASRLLFIGFAFRDEYINSILERYTSPSATIVVINPAPELPGLPFAADRVHHIPGFFERPHIDAALNRFDLVLAA